MRGNIGMPGLLGIGIVGAMAVGTTQAESIPVPNGDLSAWTGSFNPYNQALPQYWFDFMTTLPFYGNGAVVAGTGPGGLNSITLWPGYNGGNNTPPVAYPAGVNISVWTLGNASQALTQDGKEYSATVAVGGFIGGDAAGLGVPAPTFRVGLVDVNNDPGASQKYTPLALSGAFTPSVSGQWYDLTTPVAYGLAAGHGLEINVYIDGFYGINGTSWDATQATLADFRLTGASATRTWSGSSTTWDVASTPNWVEGDQLFHTGDAVVFDDTAAGGHTNVNLLGDLQAGTITVNNTTAGASTYTIGGTGKITGTASLTKQGDGTLNITNANTYTGSTTVELGTLLVSNTTGSATGTGDVVVQQGAMLGGMGTITGNVDVSGTISPSAGGTQPPAVLTTGAQTWEAGGTYEAKISAASGTPGTDWDLLQMSGLTLPTSGTFGVSVDGTTMTLSDQIYDWLIAQTSSGTFDTSKLSLSVSGFAQPFYKFILVDGSHATGITGGTPNQLYLQYNYNAVPEATTLLLGMVGLAPLLMQRRRRRMMAGC